MKPKDGMARCLFQHWASRCGRWWCGSCSSLCPPHRTPSWVASCSSQNSCHYHCHYKQERYRFLTRLSNALRLWNTSIAAQVEDGVFSELPSLLCSSFRTFNMHAAFCAGTDGRWGDTGYQPTQTVVSPPAPAHHRHWGGDQVVGR